MDALVAALLPIAPIEDRIIARRDDLRRAAWRKDRATSDVTEAQGAMDSIVAELRAMDAAQRADDTQLDHFRHQRAMALRSLESGVGNPAAAERQHATCSAEIDRLETAVLERMEARDAVEPRLAEAKTRLAAAVSRAAEVEAADADRVRQWTSELAAATAERAARAEQIPAGERNTWRLVAERKVTTTTWVDASLACSGCNRAVPADIRTKLDRGEVYVCVSCGRWVLSPKLKPTA